MEKTLNGKAKSPRRESQLDSELVVEMVGGEPYEYYPLGDHIVRAVGVCGGRPTIKYTRIDADFIVTQLAYHGSISQLVEDYEHPHLTEDAIKEALFLAASAFKSYHQTPLPLIA